MQVAVIQHDIVWCDRAANFERLRPMIFQAAESGARLVVLSETYSTGFAVENQDVAEPVDGPSSTFLAELAKQLGIWIAGSCLEQGDSSVDQRMVNTLVVASPDGARQRYHKIHPFTYGGEAEHVRPGTQHVTMNIDDVRTSLFICYDLRFADEFWAVAEDTDMYIVPANWPVKRQHHWTSLLTARAIENQAYVIGANRVGEGAKVAYGGESMIIDPWGATLAKAGDTEEIIYAEVNPEVVAETRSKFPFLPDRR